MWRLLEQTQTRFLCRRPIWRIVKSRKLGGPTTGPDRRHRDYARRDRPPRARVLPGCQPDETPAEETRAPAHLTFPLGRIAIRHDLQERTRPDREFADKGPIVRGYQQSRCADAGRENRHRNGSRPAIVAVHHGDRNERTDRLQKQAGPLDQVNLRFADEDALSTGIERVSDSAGDLALRDALAVGGSGSDQASVPAPLTGNAA
jgi:hypothetical protein